MKILASKQGESVLCLLPDGAKVEVTMVSVLGEEVMQETNVNAAVEILRQHLQESSKLGSGTF